MCIVLMTMMMVMIMMVVMMMVFTLISSWSGLSGGKTLMVHLSTRSIEPPTIVSVSSLPFDTSMRKSENTLTPLLKAWYVREMFAVPEMAMVGWGTDKTRIPELALGTVLLLPSVQVIEVSSSSRRRPGAGNSLVL